MIWLKIPGRNGIVHEDTSMRKLHLEANHKFPEDWAEQPESFKSNVKSLEELK